MIVERIVNALPVKSAFIKLLAGAALTAVVISLLMVYISGWFGYTLDPVIPSAFAATGAAIYAARQRMN